MDRLPVVTLVTREGCHLCDDAKQVLDQVRQELPFRLEVRDLDRDPELPRDWSNELPVVLVDGRKRFKVRVKERRLRRLLIRARKHPRWWRRGRDKNQQTPEDPA